MAYQRRRREPASEEQHMLSTFPLPAFDAGRRGHRPSPKRSRRVPTHPRSRAASPPSSPTTRPSRQAISGLLQRIANGFVAQRRRQRRAPPSWSAAPPPAYNPAKRQCQCSARTHLQRTSSNSADDRSPAHASTASESLGSAIDPTRLPFRNEQCRASPRRLPKPPQCRSLGRQARVTCSSPRPRLWALRCLLSIAVKPGGQGWRWLPSAADACRFS
jgi:hypothetical protein